MPAQLYENIFQQVFGKGKVQRRQGKIRIRSWSEKVMRVVLEDSSSVGSAKGVLAETSLKN